MRTSVTRAAEGFDRRLFTVDEVLRMQEAGIISDDEDFELIEGEIVPTQAKTHFHELLKSATSLAYDRGLRASLYARHNVQELWVVDAAKRRTYVNSGPAGKTWSTVKQRGPQETLTCDALPGFAITLSEV